jgi:hypothetical protein
MKFSSKAELENVEKQLEFKKICTRDTQYVLRLLMAITAERDAALARVLELERIIKEARIAIPGTTAPAAAAPAPAVKK